MGLCSSSQIPLTRRSQSASTEQLQAILTELQSQGMHLEALARHSQTMGRKKKNPKREEEGWSRSSTQYAINVIKPGHERGFSTDVRVNEDNAGLSFDLSELICQNKLLQKRLKGFEQWKTKAVMRSLFKLYSSFWFVRVHHCFQIWKYPEPHCSDLEVSSIDAHLDQESISIAREQLESDNQRILRENPLLKYASPCLVEKAISRTNLFKLFDDLLDKKQEADSIEVVDLKRCVGSGISNFAVELTSSER